MKNLKTLAVLNVLSFLVHLVPSQLTQFQIFSSQTIGEVSEKYPALFTPAGITFSIWGLIYVGLTAFCIYHLLKAYKASPQHQANLDLQQIGYLFVVNNLSTGAWTIAWVQEWLLLSVVLMVIQLGTLLAIHLKVGIFNANRSAASKWFTQIPLSLYFGWIIIATVANVSATLVGLGWNGFGLAAGTWAVIMIGVATTVVAFVVWTRTNPMVGLVGIWAFYGITLKHQTLGHEASSSISTAAWLGFGVIALMVISSLLRLQRTSQIAK